MTTENKITIAHLKKGQTVTEEQLDRLFDWGFKLGRLLTDEEVQDCLAGKPLFIPKDFWEIKITIEN